MTSKGSDPNNFSGLEFHEEIILNGGIIQNEAFSHLTLQFNRFI